MKYILLSNFRFGSTYVMGYLSEKNKQHNMPNLWEYFTSTVIPCYCSNKLSVIDTTYHNEFSITSDKLLYLKTKLELLKWERKQGNEYSMKIMAQELFPLKDNFKNILDFYKNYKFIILKRNKYDSFISNEIQNHTKWFYMHNKNDNERLLKSYLEKNNLTIKFKDFLEYCDTYNQVLSMFNYVESNYDYDVFHYENLPNLKKYFQVDSNYSVKKFNIDYNKYITNIEEVNGWNR